VGGPNFFFNNIVSYKTSILGIVIIYLSLRFFFYHYIIDICQNNIMLECCSSYLPIYLLFTIKFIFIHIIILFTEQLKMDWIQTK
jgi:hypothetical protein